MTAILTLLIVLALSLVVTRAATVALTATGMSREAARFQARSAFSGAGFTTAESESVVGHPVRRRIIMWLMLAGNAGIVAVMASVVLAAAAGSGDDVDSLVRVLGVVAGIGLIWWASRTRWVDQRITWLASAALRRWTSLDVHDYAALLHVGGEYIVTELRVEPESWLAGHTLASLSLRAEGVVVLGIEHPDGRYLGAPKGETSIDVGDVLVLYSRSETIAELDHRPPGQSGDAAHQAAVREQVARPAGEASAPPEVDRA
jgi:hypothetical protein